ncbi:S9 family peptidase [Paraglaciecola sp.]|uniref:S9 family peptidase n=2 Tax=Paraglaciecola sp. TaxID=1920173 RepID=UPI0032653495
MNHPNLKQKITTLVVALFTLSACITTDQSNYVEPMKVSETLTNEAIYGDWKYNAKRPGAVRWLDEGASYSALETAPGFEDIKLEKDRYGDDIKIYEEIVKYDPATLERTVLLPLVQLKPQGSDKALPIDDYQWSDDKSKILIFTNAEYVWRHKDRGDYWVRDFNTDELWQLGGKQTEPAQMMFGKFSPDGLKFAYVMHNNIYVQDLKTRKITALTSDGSDNVINGLFDWAYEEEFSIRDGFRWSPDSKRIAFWQLDTHAAKNFLIINNTDTLYPEVTAIPYPKVGEENAAAKIGVVSVVNAKTQWVKLPGIAKDMYLPRMDWANNNEQLLIQQMNRKQDTNTLFYANADTGEAQRFLVEEEETFIELMVEPKWLKQSDDFIWQSEKEGWKHIHRVSRDGKSYIDLTPGEFDVTQFVSIDEENGWLYFIASPDNVSQRYLQRTRLDGSGQMEQVTPKELSGTNSYQISADSSWAIHQHSSFLSAPVYSLVSLPDHKVHHVMEDNAALTAKLTKLDVGDVEFFNVKAQDGLRLDGYMLRPSNFDETKKYPLIHYVYGEPAGQTVRDIWQGNRGMWHLMMVQQGFVVSSIDNRGTAAPRGHNWRRSIYASDGNKETQDQADAINGMCLRWSFIDCDRVGVWGHSGGGSLTLNLLFRQSDIFKVGVAQAPVPDKRLYDSIYQERYSGLLEDNINNYTEVSAITHAAKLEGKLLLVHGTGDDNVHYQGSELLINELVKHNKQFDLMTYPNRRHGIVEGEGTSLHLSTLRAQYFINNL